MAAPQDTNRPPTPAAIRDAIRDNPKTRARDLAASLGVPEAALVAARVGQGVRAIAAHPDRLVPALTFLGEVMALTRNDSVVSEKVGVYDNYEPGAHAALVLNGAIDLRIFPRHWVSAYAVETEGETGPRRSIQVFDAAGDAVHKVHLRDGSDVGGWQALVSSLAFDDATDAPDFAPRQPPEVPKADPARAPVLREEWRRMTDSHQFMRLTSRLRMNRLGAYRIAGAPFAEELDPGALDAMLVALSRERVPAMVFVGNRGCIQIHSGPIHRMVETGPWQNVMDPGFNLHLRRDRVAEVWQVEKPTRRGPAISIEAFTADGDLILQLFGHRLKDGTDHVPDFARLAAGLERRTTAAAE
ncbi:hemin-degrading factor [Rhodobacterales bacterium HKCCE2091]|nr:hemin-degrading factor [Rhodobacterales bacterium HKCCE2091]